MENSTRMMNITGPFSYRGKNSITLQKICVTQPILREESVHHPFMLRIYP